jgi:cytoskeletal protein CcmA (bactofilin family)
MISPSAFSAACKNCGEYLRVQELLKPAPKAPPPNHQKKHILCFNCATELDVPAGAQSTMCRKCSCYIDLADHSIANAVSKNFKTKGCFTIQPTGYVFNSEIIAHEAVIKGRFIGKLVVEDVLTLYSTAQIKGTFTAARLLIPAANHFHWDGELTIGSAEIEGELAADLNAGSVWVKGNGRLTGTVKSRSLVAEAGAVLLIEAQIGSAAAIPTRSQLGPPPAPNAVNQPAS